MRVVLIGGCGSFVYVFLCVLISLLSTFFLLVLLLLLMFFLFLLRPPAAALAAGHVCTVDIVVAPH